MAALLLSALLLVVAFLVVFLLAALLLALVAILNDGGGGRFKGADCARAEEGQGKHHHQGAQELDHHQPPNLGMGLSLRRLNFFQKKGATRGGAPSLLASSYFLLRASYFFLI